jgi:hypothetical protein
MYASDRERGSHARAELPGSETVKFAYLFPTCGGLLALHLYPADTLDQARALYRDPTRVERLLALGSRGWALRPNFHFGFSEKGLTWTHPRLDADEYAAYWLERIHHLGAFPRTDWEHELQRLIEDGIMDPLDCTQFERDFTNSARQRATPRPGLVLARTWQLTHALAAGFPGELRGALREALSALREHRTDAALMRSRIEEA